MFKVINQLSKTVCRTINAVDYLVEAGELQAKIIRNISVADCEKKQLQLDKEIADLQKQQAIIV